MQKISWREFAERLSDCKRYAFFNSVFQGGVRLPSPEEVAAKYAEISAQAVASGKWREYHHGKASIALTTQDGRTSYIDRKTGDTFYLEGESLFAFSPSWNCLVGYIRPCPANPEEVQSCD